RCACSETPARPRAAAATPRCQARAWRRTPAFWRRRRAAIAVLSVASGAAQRADRGRVRPRGAGAGRLGDGGSMLEPRVAEDDAQLAPDQPVAGVGVAVPARAEGGGGAAHLHDREPLRAA